jgi:hypothetical protein
MQAGETLTAICKDDHLPAKNTVLRWLDTHTPFQTQYARARTALMDHYADQMVEIAFEGSNTDQIAVARDRLKVDTLKWIMSKLAHKKYGDKLAHDAGDDDGKNITVSWQRIERVIVNPAAIAAPPTPQITYDPGPLPSNLDPEILVRLVNLIKERVPKADQRSPDALLDEVMGVIDRALVAEYGQRADAVSA